MSEGTGRPGGRRGERRSPGKLSYLERDCPGCEIPLTLQTEAWRLGVLILGFILLGGLLEFILLPVVHILLFAGDPNMHAPSPPASSASPWTTSPLLRLLFGLALPAILALPMTYFVLGGWHLLLLARPTCPTCGFREELPAREVRMTSRLLRLLRWIVFYFGIPGLAMFLFGLVQWIGGEYSAIIGLLLGSQAGIALLLLFLVPPADRREPTVSFRALPHTGATLELRDGPVKPQREPDQRRRGRDANR